MNLKLYAIKNMNQRFDRVQLVVIDLDKHHRYPLNFVCVLPRYFRILERRSSKFAKMFGEKSLSMARKLLMDAAHQEEDPEVKMIIKKRIRDIEAKQDPHLTQAGSSKQHC